MTSLFYIKIETIILNGHYNGTVIINILYDISTPNCAQNRQKKCNKLNKVTKYD